jgi:hypothetical protein
MTVIGAGLQPAASNRMPSRSSMGPTAGLEPSSIMNRPRAHEWPKLVVSSGERIATT